MKIKKYLKNQQGISALIIIILVSAITLMIATTATLTGIDLLKTGLDQSKSLEVFTKAEACMEKTLLKLKTNPASKSENLSIASVLCKINIIGAGNGRSIDITATDKEGYTQKLSTQIT